MSRISTKCKINQTSEDLSLSNYEITVNDEKLSRTPRRPYYINLWQKAYRRVRFQIQLANLKLNPEISEIANNSVLSPKENKIMSDLLSFTNSEIDTIIKRHRDLLILSPEGSLYLLWILILVLLISYVAVANPVLSAFCDKSNHPALVALDLTIELAFLFDIFINFILAYRNESGVLIKSHRLIFTQYSKSWLIFDIIAALPLRIITQMSSLDPELKTQLVLLDPLPKLVKILKIFKILKHLLFIEQIDYFVHSHRKVIGFIRTISSVFLSIHIVACLFFLSAKIEAFNPQTWVSRYNINNLKVGEQYHTALYWAVTTLATIGYGEISPYTYLEKLIAMIWMIIGVYIISYSVGSMTTFYSQIGEQETILHDKVKAANLFSKMAEVPKDVHYSLLRAIREQPINTVKCNYEAVFNSIPTDLKIKVALNIYKGAITRFPFFKNKEDAFIAQIALQLDQTTFEPNHIFWIEKEASLDIFFIIHGRVAMSQGKLMFQIIQDGQYFGDIEVIFGFERRFKVESKSFVKALKMSKKVIDYITKNFPLVWKDIKNSTKIRATKLFENLAEMKAISEANELGKIKELQCEDFRKGIKKGYKSLLKEMKQSKSSSQRRVFEAKLADSKKSLENLDQMMGDLEKMLEF